MGQGVVLVGLTEADVLGALSGRPPDACTPPLFLWLMPVAAPGGLHPSPLCLSVYMLRTRFAGVVPPEVWWPAQCTAVPRASFEQGGGEGGGGFGSKTWCTKNGLIRFSLL